MGSLISASLIGVDKSNDDGKDYVSMIRQFFNKKNATNLILNGLDRKVGESFWYEIWPAMAYSMLVDLYPQKQRWRADEDHCRQLVCCYPGLE